MSSTSTAVTPTVSWLAHLRRETERFAVVVRQSPLRAHVPAYPAFTVETLTAHISRALRGRGASTETLRWFIEAFNMPEAHAARLWHAHNGTSRLSCPGFDGDSGYMTPTNSRSAFSAA